jgi:hypothetical protein
MANSQVYFMEKVVEQLKREGWKEQQSGIGFFNGMLLVNLLKDGEVICIQYDFCPEPRFIETKWPDEKRKKLCTFGPPGDKDGRLTFFSVSGAERSSEPQIGIYDFQLLSSQVCELIDSFAENRKSLKRFGIRPSPARNSKKAKPCFHLLI